MSKRYRVVISNHAERDLDAIYTFIADDSPQNALAVAARLREGTLGLDQFPERFPIARESPIDGLEIRSLLVFPYRVLYAIEGRRVLVLRVRHGAMKTLESLDEA